MKKLIIIGLLVTFVMGCAKPEINEDLTEYGTKKSESVNSKGDSQDHEHDNSED